MDKWELREKQNLPYELKENIFYLVLDEWVRFTKGKFVVSISGGIDSTLLLYLVRRKYPNTRAVFVNTLLEHPGNVRQILRCENVDTVYPKLLYPDIIKYYGYPVVSKKVSRFIRDCQNASKNNEATVNLRLTGYNRKGDYCSAQILPQCHRYLIDAPFKISEQCCDITKKKPLNKYAKDNGCLPIIGSMASEGNGREKDILLHGCNAYDIEHPVSRPLYHFTKQDILYGIKKYNLSYSWAYGNIIESEHGLVTTGETRTGCLYCLFGIHLEKSPNRIERMKITLPKHYNTCVNDLKIGNVLDYMKLPY
jgi:3'-phosphoadenosine 5'-phosphosulfate sulfotransferase (PAPS reductase)/FAD synthetase